MEERGMRRKRLRDAAAGRKAWGAAGCAVDSDLAARAPETEGEAFGGGAAEGEEVGYVGLG